MILSPTQMNSFVSSNIGKVLQNKCISNTTTSDEDRKWKDTCHKLKSVRSNPTETCHSNKQDGKKLVSGAVSTPSLLLMVSKADSDSSNRKDYRGVRRCIQVR